MVEKTQPVELTTQLVSDFVSSIFLLLVAPFLIFTQ